MSTNKDNKRKYVTVGNLSALTPPKKVYYTDLLYEELKSELKRINKEKTL